METSIDTGVVVRSFPQSNVYDVELDRTGVTIRACVNAVGFFAPLLGIQTQFRIPEGTKVVVLGATPGVIIGTLPSQSGNPKSAGISTATVFGEDVGEFEQFEPEGAAFPARPDCDMVEGEIAIRNIYKVGVSWLTHMAKLQAGERAKVETILFDNLVRVVCDSYQHISCMGERRIINDGGQLTDRTDITSREHEAWGLEDEKRPKMGGLKNEVPEIPEDAPTHGRWRLSKFLGHLGDMLHVFVTDPVEAIGQLAQDRAGKFHVHMSSDGSLVVQSVADIVFERVSRVLVPVEEKEYSNPEGNTAGEEPDDFLDTWKFDAKNPWMAAFQLREYARWLAQYNAYARFLQKDKDWSVPSEADSAEPSYANGDKQKERTVPPQMRNVRVTYATYRLMRDGSYVVFDGYGSSLMMAGGSIWLSAAKDLHLEAGRNVTITAGGSLYAKARKHIELVAVLGRWIGKARDQVSIWSEQAPILLRTMMRPDERGEPAASRFARSETGILLDAPNSNVLVAGDKVAIEARNEEDEAALKLSSLKGISICAGTGGSVRLAGQKVLAHAERILVRASDVLSLQGTVIDFGRLLLKTGGRLVASRLDTPLLQAKNIISGTLRKAGMGPHGNHVDFSESAQITMPDPPNTQAEDKNRATPTTVMQVESQGVRCDYLPRAEYGTESLQHSLSQQVADQDTHPADLDYETWNFVDDSANGDADAVFTHPWPGPQARKSVQVSTKSLHTLSSDPPSEHKPQATPAEEQPASFRYTS